MQTYRELESSGLITRILDSYEKPDIFKGYFGFECYQVCIPKDIILEPHSSSMQSTGIMIKVPPGCIAAVSTAYKPNGCAVEEKFYASTHGEIELILKCRNDTAEEIEVYGGYPTAHLYLYEIDHLKREVRPSPIEDQ